MMDANTPITPMQVSTEYTQARMTVAMLDLASCLPDVMPLSPTFAFGFGGQAASGESATRSGPS